MAACQDARLRWADAGADHPRHGLAGADAHAHTQRPVIELRSKQVRPDFVHGRSVRFTRYLFEQQSSPSRVEVTDAHAPTCGHHLVQVAALGPAVDDHVARLIEAHQVELTRHTLKPARPKAQPCLYTLPLVWPPPPRRPPLPITCRPDDHGTTRRTPATPNGRSSPRRYRPAAAGDDQCATHGGTWSTRSATWTAPAASGRHCRLTSRTPSWSTTTSRPAPPMAL
jgi:hypothetical protein